MVAVAAFAATALLSSSLVFVQPGQGAHSQAPSARAAGALRGYAAPAGAEPEMPSQSAWFGAAPLLSLGAALGLLASVVAPAPARAITFEQFNQLTYSQVKGSGLANRCPTVENQGSSGHHVRAVQSAHILASEGLE